MTDTTEVTRAGALGAFAVAAFGVFVAADDLLVVSTMLRPMIADVGLILPDDLGTAAWIVNSYLIAYLAVMPIAGKLSDVVGRRRVFVTALALFALGSVLVPLAPNLAWLLVGRALTAVGGGALVPVAFGLVGDLFRGPDRSRAFGALGAIETFGWIWGPIYGALLVRFLSWHWQFYLNVPLALVGMALARSQLPGGRRSREPIDWLGAALLTGALTGLGMAVLSQAQIQGVSGLDELTGGSRGSLGAVSAAVGTLCLAGFALRQRLAPVPLLDLRFPSASWRAEPPLVMGINVLFGTALVIALVNVPLYVNVISANVAQGAVRSGWLLTALTGAMALCSYGGGALAARRGPRRVSAAGFALATVGFALMGLRWPTGVALTEMAAHLALVGAGLGLALTPTTTALVNAAAPARAPDLPVVGEPTGSAAGLVVVFRMIGFSIGLAVLTVYGVRRYAGLRQGIELPPLTDPGYQAAARTLAVELTGQSLSETFLGAALAALMAVLASLGLSRRRATAGREAAR